jgi:multisubunit Na+/H+ antiporter MnhG subunit
MKSPVWQRVFLSTGFLAAAVVVFVAAFGGGQPSLVLILFALFCLVTAAVHAYSLMRYGTLGD